MQTKELTLNLGSKVTDHQIQDGGSRHIEETKTVITPPIFVQS